MWKQSLNIKDVQHDGLYRVLSGQNEDLRYLQLRLYYSNGLIRQSSIIQPNFCILAVLPTTATESVDTGLDSHCYVVGQWQ